MEFIAWGYLATYAGAVAFTGILVQISKEWKFVKKMPTQVWSYILALIILLPATYFTVGFDMRQLGLVFFNAVLVSLAANGGFSIIKRFLGKDVDGVLKIDTINANTDTYRFDLGENLDKLGSKKKITLKVDPNADLSQE